MIKGDAKRMLPLVARAFAELGYRRATTATLARRCGVRENVLYRAWPNKKAMFIASIEFVWEYSIAEWQPLLAQSAGDPARATRRILEYEAAHHGELGLHRLVYTGLSEADDPDIAAALRRMYRGFQTFITTQVAQVRKNSRPTKRSQSQPDDDVTAWALVGLATVANIGRELKLITERERSALYTRVGSLLLEGLGG